MTVSPTARLFCAVHYLSQHFASSPEARSGWLAHGVLFIAAVVTVVFVRQQRAELETGGEVPAPAPGCPPLTGRKDGWGGGCRARRSSFSKPLQLTCRGDGGRFRR